MKNILFRLLPVFGILIQALTCSAQVSITSDNSLPDPSAMLDVKSTGRGLLIPRMTHAQLAAIPSPAEGLMVFCTDCGSGSLSIYIGGTWSTISIDCLSPASPLAAEHQATRTEITWRWDPVPYATGYSWSTGNDYSTATDLLTATSITESGLSSNTSYTRYIWAYNACGESVVTVLTHTTAPPVLPTVTTAPVTGIGLATATCGGEVTDDGGAPVTARGICWGTSPSPDITGSHTDGTGTGAFSATLTELSEGTIFYARAYAVNAAGVSYGNEIIFCTYVRDYNGYVYKTIMIGSQAWLAENLRTTSYSDGTAIPNVTNNSTWEGLTTGAYSWYQNNFPTYGSVYGALYNFHAVSTGKLCPAGWHVPTDAEWCSMESFIDPTLVCNPHSWNGTDAGGKLKETGTTHWYSPNVGATNSTGFTALPGGFRDNGEFWDIPYIGIFWTASEYNSAGAWRHWIHHYYSAIYKTTAEKQNGYSVRCIKD